MKIHNIFNNNVISILDDEGQERIAMGRGIVFSKKSGEKINPKTIEIVFT